MPPGCGRGGGAAEDGGGAAGWLVLVAGAELLAGGGGGADLLGAAELEETAGVVSVAVGAVTAPP
ncbi:MAG: conjugal transfer protein TrbL, partial [Catenulispora sp.]